MKHTRLFILPLLAISIAGSAIAGTAETPVLVPEAAPVESPWEFRITPYGWFTGLEGTLGVGPLSMEIDESFLDIVDSLKMAAALQLEARNGRWGIMADGFYAYLGASGETRSSLYGDSRVDLKQFLGEIAVAYRVYQGPNSFVDLYGGFRYNSLDLDMNVELDVAGIDAANEEASQRRDGNR
jgi:hypothetical protein